MKENQMLKRKGRPRKMSVEKPVVDKSGSDDMMPMGHMGKMHMAPVMKGEELGKPEPDKHEVDSWMNTLADAHEIASDEVKMGHVKKRVGRKMKAISSLSDLKKAYNDKFGPEED